MKNDKSYILYTITIFAVIFNLIIINVLIHPDRINFLSKIGFLNINQEQSITTLIIFILLFSFITCILLIISFIVLIKKLVGMNKPKLY